MQAKWKCAAAAVALVGVIAMPGVAQARGSTDRIGVDIIDRSDGRMLPIYTYEGRRYVVGKPGNEYAIRLRNDGGERALAVMSVDGVNVISGDTASPSQSGYVLGAHASFDIAGWRTSLSRTAAFYFTTLENSYAARTGRPDNVGVIGVAVFRERPRPVVQFGGKLEMRDQARADADRATPAPSSAPAAAAGAAPAASGAGAMAERKSQVGTGYGRGETSYVQYTDFERASDTPSETIAIYYDSYENLLAQGVPVGYAPIARARPEPFPDAGRFAPPPR
jgi:hypothetical protein